MVGDARGIAEVHVASWRAAYRGLLPQVLLDGLSVERRAEGWRENLRRGGGNETWVAVGAAQRVLGFVSVGRSRDDDAADSVGELLAIYLRPELWGAGVGGGLHAAALTTLSRRFDEATLWVLDGNSRARGFYERHGWCRDGSTKHETLGGADVVEVRYRKPLAEG